MVAHVEVEEDSKALLMLQLGEFQAKVGRLEPEVVRLNKKCIELEKRGNESRNGKLLSETRTALSNVQMDLSLAQGEVLELRQKLANIETERNSLQNKVKDQMKEIASLSDSLEQSEGNTSKAIALNEKAINFGKRWKFIGSLTAVAGILTLSFSVWFYTGDDARLQKKYGNIVAEKTAALQDSAYWNNKASGAEKAVESMKSAIALAQKYQHQIEQEKNSVELNAKSLGLELSKSTWELAAIGKMLAYTSNREVKVLIHEDKPRLTSSSTTAMIKEDFDLAQGRGMVLQKIGHCIEGHVVASHGNLAFLFSVYPRLGQTLNKGGDWKTLAECLNDVFDEDEMKLIQKKVGKKFDWTMTIHSAQKDGWMKDANLHFEKGKFSLIENK